VLTPQEIDELMAVMQPLRDEGRAIVFITHKLREVREVADRITVMRRGKSSARPSRPAPRAELAELMVGRAVDLTVDKDAPSTRRGPSCPSRTSRSPTPRAASLVDDVDLEVRGGEISCIAGVQGNGQTELADALLGP
jgi:ABC-type uncharacterized transport system ATPase subunit